MAGRGWSPRGVILSRCNVAQILRANFGKGEQLTFSLISTILYLTTENTGGNKMEARKIIIDDKIDKGQCPGLYFCTVATTGYDQITREHQCYICWKRYCIENNFEIGYQGEE